MSRDIFLAVEATGLDTETDRIVEIVAMEAIDSKLTGAQFQVLLDPGRPIECEAELAMGYDNEQLAGLPSLGEMAPGFIKFVNGAKLIAFNADWAFALVESELARLNLPPLPQHVRQLKDIRSLTDKLKLKVRLPLDKLAVLFDCREPVQTCSQTWRDCFMLAQVFPRLDDVDVDRGMNIIQLENSVPVIKGPFGTRQIEIAAIPEPWRAQFVRWLCAGEVNGDERIHRCHESHWSDWLTNAPAQCPELAPALLDEFPFRWTDVREAMRKGYQRALMSLEGKFVRYRDDPEREMRYQAANATYGVHEKTLHEAFMRGYRRGLKRGRPGLAA